MKMDSRELDSVDIKPGDDQPTASPPSTHAAFATSGNDDQVPALPGDADIDADGLVPPLPPDGGWGWAVVAASFMANLILDGVCYTFGIINPVLREYFQAGKGKTALVGSMLPGFYLIVGKPGHFQKFFSTFCLLSVFFDKT